MENLGLRESLCRGAYQLWLRGLLAGEEGLLSVEITRRRYHVTPQAKRRADLTPTDIISVDLGGDVVGGGSGVDVASWRPHRIAYQMTLDAPDRRNGSVHATAMVQPPAVMALLRARPDDVMLALDSVGGVPVARAGDAQHLQQAIETQRMVAIPSVGLFVAGTTLPAVLNRLESIAAAAEAELLGR